MGEGELSELLYFGLHLLDGLLVVLVCLQFTLLFQILVQLPHPLEFLAQGRNRVLQSLVELAIVNCDRLLIFALVFYAC